jgi:hypothetical protein
MKVASMTEMAAIHGFEPEPLPLRRAYAMAAQPRIRDHNSNRRFDQRRHRFPRSDASD